ncbi:hypothetical protein Tco_0875877 [Tanacetum coccineum]|uniref:Uncharacterized protein n=1 Tax=Tanacetum coccineum TaxID=301880 RepID=A0ABQ5BR22_9ASTR
MSVLQIKHCATFGLVLAYIVSETSDSNKEGPLKIASLKDASQGDKDDARPIATRAMRLLRSEMSRVEHAEAAKGTDTTDWGPHVETTWCVCQELLIAGLPATYLNDCGVVEGSDPYC